MPLEHGEKEVIFRIARQSVWLQDIKFDKKKTNLGLKNWPVLNIYSLLPAKAKIREFLRYQAHFSGLTINVMAMQW